MVLLFVLFFVLVGANTIASLGTTPRVLHGPVGPDLRIVSVSRRSAFNHIKNCQLQQLNRNAPPHVLNELDVARERLRDPVNNDEHVAFLSPRLSDQVLFTIVYRIRERRPNVYTLEAIVREPESEIRSSDVQHVVRQIVARNMGFLQSYPLKTWARGKYVNESYLESLIFLHQ